MAGGGKLMGRRKKEQELDQLTIDAMTAYALGMSYGKYKAMLYDHQQQERERQERLVAEAKRRKKERIGRFGR